MDINKNIVHLLSFTEKLRTIDNFNVIVRGIVLSLLIIMILSNISLGQGNRLKAIVYPTGDKLIVTEVVVGVKQKKDFKYMDVMSVVKNIYYIEQNGSVAKLKTKDVDSLLITDFSGEKYFFQHFNNDFLHRVHNVRIKWFRLYKLHRYDYSLMAQEFFLDSEQKLHKYGLFTNRKAELKEMVRTSPVVSEKVDSISWNLPEILKILQEFDTQ